MSIENATKICILFWEMMGISHGRGIFVTNVGKQIICGDHSMYRYVHGPGLFYHLCFTNVACYMQREHWNVEKSILAKHDTAHAEREASKTKTLAEWPEVMTASKTYWNRLIDWQFPCFKLGILSIYILCVEIMHLHQHNFGGEISIISWRNVFSLVLFLHFYLIWTDLVHY